MEIWPVFDILHTLRLYLCHKRGALGFYKQATHRRSGDEPFFTLGSTVHEWGWPKKVHFWPKMAGLSTFHSGPKRTKMVNQSVFSEFGTLLGPSGPFWPFQTKNDFLLRSRGQSSMKKWPFLPFIILPWMASYGFEISFLWMLASAKTNFPLLTLTSVCEYS